VAGEKELAGEPRSRSKPWLKKWALIARLKAAGLWIGLYRRGEPASYFPRVV